MKTKKLRRSIEDVLQRYESGERNFKNSDLRGLNFKGQTLVGIDLSGSDIRGTNFSKANLTKAKLVEVEAGIPPSLGFTLMTASLLISFAGCALAAISGILLFRFLEPNIFQPLIASISLWIVTTTILFLITWTSQQLSKRGIFGLKLTIANLIAILTAALGLILGILGSVRFVLLTIVNFAPHIGIYNISKYLIIVLVIVGLGQGIVTGLSITKTFAYLTYKYVVSDLSIGFGFLGIIAGLLTVSERLMLIPSLMISISPIIIGWFCGKGAIECNPTWLSTRNAGIFFAGFFSTNFRGADLSQVDLSGSTLRTVNFDRIKQQETVLTQVRWHNAKDLGFAKLGNSILTNDAVRILLVTLNGDQKSYIGADLRGANLIDAKLRKANLKRANISDAIFQRANLEEAKLTLTEAIGTDFTNAQMTGACVEAWNIESNTKIDNVDCRFIYLLEDPKPRTDDRERRPSSGEFAPGEFTKLFQKVLTTVDLIFRNGVDWKAFTLAFDKVQTELVESEGTEIAVQSIENKGDGVVVVRVNIPPNANKGKIHKEFTQNYELALKAIEEKYQDKLESKDEQIILYRQQLEDHRQREIRQNSNMEKIIDILAKTAVNLPVNEQEVKAIAERQTAVNLVILTLGIGDFEKGFPSVIAQIWTKGDRLPIQHSGKLLPAPEIVEVYHHWQSQYNRFIDELKKSSRMDKKKSETNCSQLGLDLEKLAEDLEEKLNKWLNAEQFLPIDRILREKFNRSDEIQVIIQSENIDVRRLPWHLWDFFKPYRKAEVAFSSPFYDRSLKTAAPRNRIRILSILGNDRGLNLHKERQLIAKIDAEPAFLDKPNRQQLDENLWSEKGWDILCFSGHSSSTMDGSNGYIEINDTDKITIPELENALRQAIDFGLQIAIFNSCDGLGLANQLASLHIPQIIVMRELVPDGVAQNFLNNFLTAFASGKSFYLAVREAREKLQGLENYFPCASWLPVICQNPAEIPPTWDSLGGISRGM